MLVPDVRIAEMRCRQSHPQGDPLSDAGRMTVQILDRPSIPDIEAAVDAGKIRSVMSGATLALSSRMPRTCSSVQVTGALERDVSEAFAGGCSIKTSFSTVPVPACRPAPAGLRAADSIRPTRLFDNRLHNAADVLGRFKSSGERTTSLD
jgi:hypothetical protein